MDVTHFPRPVRVVENAWIPLSDGSRLAARLWLPADADVAPVPAVLELLPYRKRDLTRPRDEPMCHYFAGHGYAAVRVDMRGSGDSDGVLLDEYLPSEQDDAVEVIAWLASQPWCTGAVGMMGKSWGGFNALQVAARRPPALKAIITVCSTDDRYADDVHYMGGCVLTDNTVWGAIFMSYLALPPDPALVGARWRAMFRERLEALRLFPEVWLRHPRRDAYWKHASVCEDYGALECAVYAVGGWADAYSNAVPRLLAGLTCPRKGLLGPWAHLYPHDGLPGPAIGFLQEALRWWDHWLKGLDTGVMDEPMLRAWMQRSAPPSTSPTDRPGRWVAERAWPSPRLRERCFSLAPGCLLPSEGGAGASGDGGSGAAVAVRSPQATGLEGGDWYGMGVPGDLPGDQRPDDGGSLVFDSAPLAEPLEILGAAEVSLTVATDRAAALVAVRLEDVAPDGASERVTWGVLDLTHRSGHERLEAVEPGRHYRVRVALNDVAHAFTPGHRLRLAISTSYWPLIWPAAEPFTLTVFPAACRLTLPERPPSTDDAKLAPFGRPERAASATPPLKPKRYRRTVTRDLVSGETVYTVASQAPDEPARIEAIDLEVAYDLVRRYAIANGDPLSARVEVVQRVALRRGEWSVEVDLSVATKATRREWVVEGELVAREGGAPFAERRWRERIPRDGV